MTESCFHGHKAALLAFINERNIVHLRTLQLTKWYPLRLYGVGFFERKEGGRFLGWLAIVYGSELLVAPKIGCPKSKLWSPQFWNTAIAGRSNNGAELQCRKCEMELVLGLV